MKLETSKFIWEIKKNIHKRTVGCLLTMKFVNIRYKQKTSEKGSRQNKKANKEAKKKQSKKRTKNKHVK